MFPCWSIAGVVLQQGRVPSNEQNVLRLLGLSGLSVGVFLLEALDAAGGVDEFLLAGEKRMAAGADFDTQHVALDGGTSLEGMAASAMDGHFVIVGVNTGFHGICLSARPVCAAPRTRCGRAASLGHAQTTIIQEKGGEPNLEVSAGSVRCEILSKQTPRRRLPGMTTARE